MKAPTADDIREQYRKAGRPLPSHLLAPAKPSRLPRGQGKVGRAKKESALQRNFPYRWQVLGGPTLDAEYVFDPVRKWRFDHAHPASKTAFELHGGIWTDGRHVRGGGFRDDREKMNAAAVAGWIVIELVGGKDISAANIERLIRVVREREAAAGRANGTGS